MLDSVFWKETKEQGGEEKMKKSIIIGLCITSLLLIITPTISANEYRQIEKARITTIENNLHNFRINLNSIYDQLKIIMDNEFLFKEKSSHIENIIKNRHQLIDQINSDVQQTSFLSIFNLIISLLLALIGTIIGIVFGPFIAIIVAILTAPAVILAKLIEFIINIIFLS